MSEEYSEVVYRCPGMHHRPGGTFDWRGVKSPEELESALNEGWFRTLAEAVDGKHIPRDVEESEQENENAPPTREEMEAKAKELGVKFFKKTTDEELLGLINSAIESAKGSD